MTQERVGRRRFRSWGGEELEQRWKKRRKQQDASSSWSEASTVHREDIIIVRVEPPKSSIKTEQVLTFPMGDRAVPLPKCEGPKLEAFSGGNVLVKFVRELGGNAVHSNVFEVIIDGKQYALKLFRTSSAGYFPGREYWPKGSYPEPREMAYHFRPFYRECRAYGKINERGLSHRYWRSYGYLRLPPNLRDELCDITGLPDHYWQVRPFEMDGRDDKPTYTVSEQLSWPIYGIVKELAPSSSTPVDPKRRNIRTMLADLRHLHKIGIINTDIADRNYIAGRLIDFSLAYTLPHLWFSRPDKTRRGLFPSSFKNSAYWDIERLRSLIIDSGVQTTAVQDVPDGCVALSTRSRRVMRTQGGQARLTPLYELGVNEPQTPTVRSSVDRFSVPSLDSETESRATSRSLENGS